MSINKKIYFLSDFHLGVPDYNISLEREKKIISFLNEAEKDAAEIFILGDMFDFWFEYKHVVPKGFVRLLGKLATLADAGINIHFFVGNHDMWMKNYFQTELQAQVYFEPQEFIFSGKKFLIGHGDGLGPGDKGYKFLKKVFRNPVSNFLFGILPPAIGIGTANYFSKKSRLKTMHIADGFMGAQGEWLIQYSTEKLKSQHYDYFVFGHRHLPIEHRLTKNATYINLGDWINHFTYAVFDGDKLSLATYEK